MMGRERGLVQHLKVLHPHLISYHCTIHQSVLCASLGEIYSEIMATMMKLVNFESIICTAALLAALVPDGGQ